MTAGKKNNLAWKMFLPLHKWNISLEVNLTINDLVMQETEHKQKLCVRKKKKKDEIYNFRIERILPQMLFSVGMHTK